MRKATDAIRWVQTWTDDRAGTFRIGRCADDLIAEWVGIATLRADRSGSRIAFDVSPACDVAWAAKLRRGHAAALVGHLHGTVTLHASAVAGPAGAILLLGESGSGKSTLAAALCGRPELALLCDDTASLAFGDDSVFVHPSESANWLALDACEVLGHTGHAAKKVPAQPNLVATSPAPLRAIVKLTFDDEDRCDARALVGRGAFETLCRSLFRFVLDEPEVTLRDFAQLGRLVARVPVYELRRPRTLARLSASRVAIEDILNVRV